MKNGKAAGSVPTHLVPVIIALVFAMSAVILSGCNTPAPPRPLLADSKSIHWESFISDLDCSGLNRGIEILGVQISDVRIRGVRDAFVWVDCYHDTSPWPHQLEVFDGSSDAANPQKMAVLIDAKEHELIRGVSFSESAVQVDIARYAEWDGLCCPSINERRIFTWDGAKFVEKR